VPRRPTNRHRACAGKYTAVGASTGSLCDVVSLYFLARNGDKTLPTLPIGGDWDNSPGFPQDTDSCVSG
jgi:hypothetical protein